MIKRKLVLLACGALLFTSSTEAQKKRTNGDAQQQNRKLEQLTEKIGSLALDDPELAYRAAVFLNRAGGSKRYKTDRVWRRERRGEIVGLFELTSGALAMEQSLQLMTGRDPSPAEEKHAKSISVGTLEAPKLKPHDFKALIGDKSVSVPESARLIPHDALAVRFDTIKHAIRMSDIAKRFKEQLPFFVTHLAQGDDFERKMLAQFALKKPGPIIRKFYGVAISEMNVVVEDPYLMEGADMAFIFTLSNKFLFKERIGAYRVSFKKQYPDAREGSIDYKGFAIHTLTTPDGILRAHTVEHENYWIIASSPWMAKRIVDTITRSVRSIADNPDYRYLLSIHREPGDAFVYIGDDFVSKVISAPFKIAELRRVSCEANLKVMRYARNLFAIEHGSEPSYGDLTGKNAYLPKFVCPDDGSYEVIRGVPRCNRHGTLGGLHPLSVNTVEMVTDDEAGRYRAFVEGYNRYWTTYVDPIGIRVDMGANISVRTVILPLVENSEYRMLQAVMGGDPIRLDAVSLGGKTVVLHAASKIRALDGYKGDLSHVEDQRVRQSMEMYRMRFKETNPDITEDPYAGFGNELDFFFVERDLPEKVLDRVLDMDMRVFEQWIFRHVIGRIKVADVRAVKAVLPRMLREFIGGRSASQSQATDLWAYNKKLDGDVLSFGTFGHQVIILLRKDGLWITGRRMYREGEQQADTATKTLEKFMEERDAFFSSSLQSAFKMPKNRTGNFEVGFYPANLDSLRLVLNFALHHYLYMNCASQGALLKNAVALHEAASGIPRVKVFGELGKYLPGRTVSCPLGGAYSLSNNEVQCSIHRTALMDDKVKRLRLFTAETEVIKVLNTLKFIVASLGFTKEGIDTRFLIRDPLE